MKTARGHHVYFIWPNGKTQAFDDGELRADGVYVVLPPSIHASGVVYEWLIELGDEPPPTIDPFECGLAQESEVETEYTEYTEYMEHKEYTEAIVEWATTPQNVYGALVYDLPRQPGHRNGSVFNLARALKAVPEYADAPGRALRPVVRQWFNLIRHRVGTKTWDKTWDDFLHAWKNVQFPIGDAPFDRVVHKALAGPYPPEADEYDEEGTRQLVAICKALGEAMEGGVFYLAARTAARVTGYTTVTAWRRLGMLVNEGILELVEKGRPPARASRYRWIGAQAVEDGRDSIARLAAAQPL